MAGPKGQSGSGNLEIPRGQTSDIELIRNFDLTGSVESIKAQKEAIQAAQNALASVLAKIKDGNAALDLGKVEAKALPLLVEVSKIELTPTEKAAMGKMKEGLDRLGLFLGLPAEYWGPVQEKAEALASSNAEARRKLEEQKKEVGAAKPAESAETEPDTNAIRSEAHLVILSLLKTKVVKPEEATGLGDQSAWKKIERKVSGPAREQVRRIANLDPKVFAKVDLVLAASSALEQLRRDGGVEKAKEEESLWDKVSGKTKEFYRNHTTLSQVALVTAGALGTYQILKYFWKKTGKEKMEEASKSKSQWALGLGAVAVVGLGIFLGKDHLAKWFKEQFGPLFEAKKQLERYAEAAKAFREGRIMDAIKIMTEGEDPNEELHKKAVERFRAMGKEVSQDSLRLMGTMGYGAFMGQHESWTEYASAKLNQAQKAIHGDNPLKLIYDARPDLSGGGQRLMEAFKILEETKGADGKPLIDRAEAKDKTVDQVLELVLAKDLSTAQATMVDSGKKDSDHERIGALEYNKQLFSNASKEMLEDFKWLNEKVGGGAVYDVIEDFDLKWNKPAEFERKYPGKKGGFEWGDAVEFPKEFIKQCKQHSIALAISAGTIAVWDGMAWVAKASIAPLGGFFYELANGGSFTDAVAVYGAAASPFIVFGAAKGFLQGNGVLGKLAGVAKGGAKGVFWGPMKAVEVVYDAQYYGFRAKQYARSKLSMAKTKIGAVRPRLFNAEEGRLHAYTDRIIALEEKKHLLNQKLGEKVAWSAKKDWKAEVEKIKSEIEYYKDALTTKGKIPKEIIEKRITLQMEGLYGKKINEARAGKLAKMMAEELVDPEHSGNRLSKVLLFERHENRLTRLLAELDFNEAFIDALVEDKQLMELLQDKKLLRNSAFMESLEMGIRNGALVNEGKFSAGLVKVLAQGTINQPNFAVQWMRALKEKLGERWDKMKDDLGQRQVFRTITEKYRNVAEKAGKAREAMSSLKAKAIAGLTASDAKSKLEELGKIANPTEVQQKEMNRLIRFLEKDQKALIKIKSNKMLSQAWEQYQSLLASNVQKMEGRALSASRFLAYQSFFANAAKFGGIAGVVLVVHSFENAENKADFIGQFTAGSLGVAAGLKFAQAGFRFPGPIYVKAAGVILGLVGGVVGASALESAYNYGARTVGDRYFINRGQGKGWEQAGSVASVLGGGTSNFAELFNYYDVWNNVDLDEVVDERAVNNPFAYQSYLTASSVDVTGNKRHYYRSIADWDREIRQLIEKTEKKIAEKKEEMESLPEKSKEREKIQEELEQLWAQLETVEENQLPMEEGQLSDMWKAQQEALLVAEEENLMEQKEEFIKKMPANLQPGANTLIGKIQERIMTRAGFLVDPDNPEEEKLWIRLRDVAPIKVESEDGEGNVVEKEMGFPEWFLTYKEFSKRRFVYEQIRDFGKLQDITLIGDGPKPAQPEKSPPADQGEGEPIA